MELILGIDTGGTFTDVVLWDVHNKQVLQKSKSFTTNHDLTIGIDECMSMLDLGIYSDISAVHLSTTLSCNAIIENTLAKTGLLTIGKYLPEELPVHDKYEIINCDFNCKHNTFYLTPQIAQELVERFSEDYYALAVSADGENALSIEKAAAESISKLIDTPVICCSELFQNNDFYDRTLNAVTALGLKPILSKWASAIRNTMKKYNVTAPVKMYTGSGDLVTLEEAIENPICTIMTGPVLSFAGSTNLTDESDYLLLDMGGTSLDITKVENRQTRFCINRTAVGEYRFSINTLDLQSFGTGGDSIIRLNGMGKTIVGPQKVTPLCVLGCKYPHLTDELLSYRLPEVYDLCTANDTDCYYINNSVNPSLLTYDEQIIIRLLSGQPHSLMFLADGCNKDPDALHMDDLLKKGYICRASLTPTDILHGEGTFTRWNTEIAETGIRILADKKGISPSEFIAEVKEIITNQLSFFCMQSIAGFEKKSFQFSDSKGTMYLIDKYLSGSNDLLTSEFSIQKPIVGVGAPAGAWLPAVAEKLHAELIIPENGDVACAIGAAAGKAD